MIREAVCIALAGGAGSLASGVVSAQVGHVVGAQKISDTAGGLPVDLDDEDQLGRSIVNLGDLDGDGVSDLLVGAHTDDDGGLDRGAVYVLFMAATGQVKGAQKISDLEGGFYGWLDHGDQFGRAAACLGDLDGDGVVDVAVSSNYDDDGGSNTGAVYVLFLTTAGTVKAVQKISPLHGGLPAPLKIHDEFGRSIAALGDLNGDGTTDLVVGTPEDDDGGTNTGALHVLFLNPDGTVKDYSRISRSTSGLALKPGDWFGHSVASLGDFDGDGVTDIVVGAVLDDDGGINQGSVWILCLEPDGSVKSAREIDELEGGFAELDDFDQFGTSVCALGDLDGNGVTDIAVGAVKDDDGGEGPDADVGAVYVLFLEADATVSSWVKIGEQTGGMPHALDQYDWFGSALCRLGGSPGDPPRNLAIGCRNDDDGGPNRGALYLVRLNDGTVPAADFVVDRTLGVAPLTVAFTDTTTGEATAWVWSFGDGTQSSLRNPGHTYATPGVYDVQLTARGPGGKDVELKVGRIDVVAGPLAGFAPEPGRGLVPLEVAFVDLSEGEVTSWAWDFGDGATSIEAEPVHVFGAGTFDVSLTVTGPSGTDTLVVADAVTAVDLAPVADFAPAGATSHAPYEVVFEDRSEGLVTSWAWSFGDGGTSTEADPAHVYLVPGTYDVSLTATGPYGTDALTRVGAVVVNSPVPSAAIGLDRTQGVAPLRVQFSDLSTGDVTSWLWDFGDGTASNAPDPVHVYDEPGVYDVALLVGGPLGVDGAVELALVEVAEPPPSADFFTSSRGGFAPLTVGFTDQSSGEVTAWLWDFGDGTTSTAPEPVHDYTTPGTYTVSLVVRGPTGTDEALRADWIVVDEPVPTAAFDAAPSLGVAPLEVAFHDASLGDVTAWAWNFGDGQVSGERDPLHVYTAPGTYTVRLVASGPAGSSELVAVNRIQVLWPAPAAEFSFGPTTGFAPLPVAFSDLTTGNATSWFWRFGDGTTSRQRFPVKNFNRPGSYVVTLTASGPGGTTSVVHGPLVVEELPRVPAGGFESQPADAPPTAPWTSDALVAVIATDALPDGGFPSDGAKWLDVSGDGSAAATPAAVPGGPGAPPTGTVGVAQAFPFHPVAPFLTFSAAFLLGDQAASAQTNDFMSVDLSDGSTSWNLFHADGFSELPYVSERHGLPMTETESVWVDLRELFPGIQAGAPLTLRVGVGNGGDGLNPSRGYVDAFRLAPAARATFRNGRGGNQARYTSSPAVLGGQWTVQVDVTGHADARQMRILGYQRPASGLPVRAGERLVSGQRLFFQSWLVQPGLNVQVIDVPLDLSLVGQFMATQATITGGGGEYCNAYDLVLGF